MPLIRSFTLVHYFKLVLLVLSFGKIILFYSCYAEKGLIYIATTAASSCQLFFVLSILMQIYSCPVIFIQCLMLNVYLYFPIVLINCPSCWVKILSGI